MKYEFEIIETVAQSRTYEVEAGSLEEATEKALAGETTWEETNSHLGVVSRSLDLEE